MDQITLVDAARTVFLTIAPLIAGGALAKIGEDITDAAKETLGHAWEQIEARFKRTLTEAERADLLKATQVVETRMAGQPKAAGALAYYRADAKDTAALQIVEAQLVEVFTPTPDELIALAKAIAAMQPTAPPVAGSRTVTVSGTAQVGNVIQGDINGNLTLGPVDFSRNKRIASPSGVSAPGVGSATAGLSPAGGAPGARREPPPATLSADGIHFTYGHALIIGVGAYQDPAIPKVSTTAADARALAALLRDPQLAAYPDDQVHVLVDAKATRDRILDALEELAHRADGGTSLIFFAGHGEQVPSQYPPSASTAGDGQLAPGGERSAIGDRRSAMSYALLPYDADLKHLAETTITAELFHKRVAKIRERAKRLIVLLNCCHAGGVGDAVLGGEEAAVGGTAPPPEFYRPLAVGSGQVVISSSRPTQKSGACSHLDTQHTTFGAHLLDALRGQAPGAGAGVGVFELFAYLRAQVPPDAQHITYKQKPLVQEPLFYASQLDDNIAVALRPGGQGGTLGNDILSLARRLAALELASEAGALTPAQSAERDVLLRQIEGQ